MKHLIIIFMSIVLGVYIYNMVLGDDSDTIKTASKELIKQQLDLQKMKP